MFRVQAMLSVFQEFEDRQTVVDAQFLVDVVDVDPDGILGDEQLPGDHFVLPSPHQEGKDFPLPLDQFVFIHEGSEVELFPETETKFFLKVVDARVEFVTDSSGNVTSLVLTQGGLRMTAKRTRCP
jgi:hypothetical protein